MNDTTVAPVAPTTGPSSPTALANQPQQTSTKVGFAADTAQAVLSQLLKKIDEVNFREMAGDSIDDEKKLAQKHYLVLAVENILTLARDNGYDLCKRYGFLYVYNGQVWILIEEDELEDFLGKAAERMGIDRFNARHYEFRQRLLKQFLASGRFTTVPRPAQTVLVNLKNGTYQITATQQGFRQFQRADFLTYQLPFDYNPTATAPLFTQYLHTVLPDNDLRNILAEYLGYVFIRHLKLEKVLLLYGGGANGKSVFFEVVNALLGTQNVSNYTLQSLTNEAYRAKLADKLLNYGSEIKGSLESDVFKQLASGEPVEAKPLYRDPFTMRDYAKLAFNCNQLPRDVEHSEAFFRRFLIVPFDVTIPENQRDPELPAKVINRELSGVFNWLLEGLHRLLRNKRFTASSKAEQILASYRKNSDTVAVFLEDEGYKPTADQNEYVALKNLYSEYRQFCISSGYHMLNSRNFQERLVKNGCQTQKKNIGQVVFVEKEPFFETTT